MSELVVIDYGAGNVRSLCCVLEQLGYHYKIAKQSNEFLSQASTLIIPGVGNFGAAMDQLKARQLIDPIKELHSKSVKIIGICVGMQLMFSSSEESLGISGLELLAGDVVKLPKTEFSKIPQIGWCPVAFDNKTRTDYYFLHSYFCRSPRSNFDEVGVRADAPQILSYFKKGNLIGAQFHPEKSGPAGLEFLRGAIDAKV